MSDAEKTTIICTALLVVGLVFAISLMASCTRDVARIDGRTAAACVESGGTWRDGLTTFERGDCIRKAK